MDENGFDVWVPAWAGAGADGDGSATAAALAAGLAELGRAAARRRRAAGDRPGGVPPLQGRVLALLLRPGPTRLRDLAEALGVAQPTASVAVDALARRGLVRKERGAGDRRALAISLTAAGRERAARAAAGDPWLAAAAALTGEERAAVLRALPKAIRALEAQGALPWAAPESPAGHGRLRLVATGDD